MRNNILFILFILLPIVSFGAANTGQFEIKTFDQHQKMQEDHSIIVNNETVEVDGAKLSITEVSIKAKYFSKLISRSKNDSSRCSSGHYIYQVKYNEISFIERNCLNSKRYSELKVLFDNFKKNVVLTDE